MTDKETLKRIKKDAHDFTEGWGENCDLRSFIAGAKSERNKTIDDCIQVLENNPGDMNLVPLLESLKL